MNINIFFTGIISSLLLIFFIFKPLNIKKQDFGEIPLFELHTFKLIELNNKGLTTIMNGVHGVRYADRYEVSSINFTDNTKKYLANMLADRGSYKGNVINLDGNINYTREDGISFVTQKAMYDKETSIVTSPIPYIASLQHHKIVGTAIEYNNNLETIKSSNVSVNYKLKER